MTTGSTHSNGSTTPPANASAAPAPAPSAGAPAKRAGADAPTVILHWSLVLTLVASLVTGLRISSDALEGSWAAGLVAVLPQGDVFRWHVWAGFAVSLLTIAYVIFLTVAGLRRRVRVDRATVRTALSGTSRARLNGWNRLVYWLGFVLLLVAMVTGIVHFLMPPFVPQAPLLFVHNASAWALVAYLVVHVLMQYAAGGVQGLLRVLRPRKRHVPAALAASVAAVVAGAALWATERATLPTLTVAGIDATPGVRLDGRLDEALWEKAEPVRVLTAGGATRGTSDNEVEISVRAVHDGDVMHVAFEWADPTRSQKHLPLVKTADGWRVMQTDYGRQDENEYYEDKFAVMWGTVPRASGGGTTHMGAKPLDSRPGPAGGRGLHYTTDGSIVDVWHWKSVRTGSALANRMDDNYFGAPMDVDPEKKRYTGGYTQDPSDGGGYTMNWESFDDHRVVPKYLPADLRMLDRVVDVDADPDASDAGQFWLAADETVPYDAAKDDLPVGTVMPSVIVKGPHAGDRGDVHAVAAWADGTWTIEARRRLATGSEYDVAFEPGGPLYLWLAAFDHAQTRHSYHLRPVRVELDAVGRGPVRTAMTEAAEAPAGIAAGAAAGTWRGPR